jgi:hypothetical protein
MATGQKTDAPRAGKTIAEFCAAYTISRSTFENWRRKGIGPAVLQPGGRGGRGIITAEAEDAWKRVHSGMAAIIEAA